MTILAGEQPFLGIGYSWYMHLLSDDRGGIDRISPVDRVPKKGLQSNRNPSIPAATNLRQSATLGKSIALVSA
jgi:hypothetical protein